MYTNNSKTKKGFTLVELVIVIAIIAILFAVLTPHLSNWLNKTKVAGVQTDFREFSVAAKAVAYEQSGFYGEGTDTTVIDQLNANLDAVNKLSGADDANAAFAKAEDPWNEAYEVKIVNKDASGHTTKDRGYVLVYTGGANGVVESTAPAVTYTDGTGFALTVNGDDMAMLVGYDENGSVIEITEGLSINIEE